ncbi:MAG: MFS transporter [Sulfuricella sp.]|nr:MFS transporter [Sulfuricella sp.]
MRDNFMTAMFRSLRHRDFRAYFIGQMVSYIGTWMQQVAMAWLAYRISGSVLVLGLVGFASQFPILLFAPFGGVFSDRHDRRRLMILTQSLSLLQTLVLAALTFSGLVEVWHLLALAVWLGLINAVDTPARQSIISMLVRDRSDLANAIALNSFAMNSARFLGPALAGFLVSLSGEGVCFLLNGASYAVVVVALLRIRLGHKAPQRQPLLKVLREGVAYTWNSKPIRTLLGIVATISFLLTPVVVFMPFYAREVFHGDARTLGLLMSCSGIGSLLGAGVLASRRNVALVAWMVSKAPFLAAASLMAFSFSTVLWLSMPLLVLVGLGMIMTVASSNTIIQTLVHDHFRGRVMSYFTVAFLGMAPLGSLAAGSVAHHLGVPATLFGGCVLGIGVLAWLTRRLQGLDSHLKAARVREGLPG